MRGRFGALVTAMVTPFDCEQKLDLAAARKLAGWLVDHGSDGLVVSGTTGEAPTLSDEEKIALWKAVLEAVGERVAVVAATGSNDTAHTIHLTRAAEEVGAHGALVVTPYYNRPPQSGLIAHFKAVAGAVGLPIMLYDIPGRTARKIEHSSLLELASVENIVAVKDSVGDVQGAARLVAEAPEGFQVYCGNDGETLPWLSVGAVGVVSVASHVVGLQMAEMISRFASGDAEGARKINAALIPIYDAMAINANPIPVKAALELIGHPVGSSRLPLVPASPEEVAKIKEELSAAGVM
ncbi:MAG: 4-hydroxy-tetrahydrodipicolinate synthase [Actinomycetota bacterium]